MEKLRVGVIGVGSVVREIYQYLYFQSDYSDIITVAAVADPNEEYRNWFCDAFGIPAGRRYASYREMLECTELDVAQINTPDSIHAGPAIDALEAGLDVLLPKPTATTVKDAHDMIETMKKTGRLLGIDFHKRQDPRIKEAEARYQSGRYGQLQVGVWYMIDALRAADPNHAPRFFASPDYAERNTPISFLTVHMADALIRIVDLKPVEARAIGYSQKLPSLEPVAVKGYDLVDTEIRFDNGATAHIITGWHLPNTAPALTVQSSRMICTDGMIDLSIDAPGYYELHPDGIFQINPLFRNFGKDGKVAGYGITSPGKIYQEFLAARNGRLDAATRARMTTPTELGFYTTLVLEGAERSLARGRTIAEGVTEGPSVDLKALLRQELGDTAAAGYGV